MSTAKELPNYYGVLGVPRDASIAVIRTAYLELARKHHPDHGGDPVEFRAVGNAYEILSDPERRAQYDRGGQIIAFGAGAAREIASNVFYRIVRSMLRQLSTHEEV